MSKKENKLIKWVDFRDNCRNRMRCAFGEDECKREYCSYVPEKVVLCHKQNCRVWRKLY